MGIHEGTFMPARLLPLLLLVGTLEARAQHNGQASFARLGPPRQGPGEIGWPCEWVSYMSTDEGTCRGHAYCDDDRSVCKERCEDTRDIRGVDAKRMNNDGAPDGRGVWCDYSAVGVLYHV